MVEPRSMPTVGTKMRGYQAAPHQSRQLTRAARAVMDAVGRTDTFFSMTK